MEIQNLQELVVDSKYPILIFDCFGTIFQITYNANPYTFLFNNSTHNFADLKDFKNFVMTHSFQETMNQVSITEDNLYLFNALLKKEIASIKFYPDAFEKLYHLHKNHTLILCSNLAEPYGDYIKKLNLPLQLVFSYEKKLTKPDPKIFELCYNKQYSKQEHLFIGDNPKNDYQAALNFGFSSILINR